MEVYCAKRGHLSQGGETLQILRLMTRRAKCQSTALLLPRLPPSLELQLKGLIKLTERSKTNKRSDLEGRQFKQQKALIKLSQENFQIKFKIKCQMNQKLSKSIINRMIEKARHKNMRCKITQKVKHNKMRVKLKKDLCPPRSRK